jgi:hypothetical protein
MWHFELAHEIGQKHDATLENANQQQILGSSVIVTDLRAEFGYAAL